MLVTTTEISSVISKDPLAALDYSENLYIRYRA